MSLRALQRLALCVALLSLVFAGLSTFEALSLIEPRSGANRLVLVRVGYALAAFSLAALAAVLALCAVWWPRSLKVLLTLLALTWGPLFVADQVYFSQVKSSSLQAMARQLGIAWDKRGLAEVVRDLRLHDPNHYPLSSPRSFLDHEHSGWPPYLSVGGRNVIPLASIANTRLVSCKESGSYPVYPTDRYGFNNPDSLWAHASFDAIIIGDSYTHGDCVEQGEDVAGQMRTAYPATLNLGISGTGPLASVAVLREYTVDRRAQFLFWLHYSNDLADTALELQNPTMSRYMDPGFSQGLEASVAEVDAAYREFIDKRIARSWAPWRVWLERVTGWAVGKNLTGLAIRRGIDALRDSTPDTGPPDTGQLQAVLKVLEGEAARLEAELVVVYLPGHIHLFTRKEEEEAAQAQKAAVLAMAQNMGLPKIDIDSAFREAGDLPRFWALSGNVHFSPEGYALVAQELVKFMQSAQLAGAGQ